MSIKLFMINEYLNVILMIFNCQLNDSYFFIVFSLKNHTYFKYHHLLLHAHDLIILYYSN